MQLWPIKISEQVLGQESIKSSLNLDDLCIYQVLVDAPIASLGKVKPRLVVCSKSVAV